ncbi:MAG: hypothetical protein MR734_02440 [Bacteroidales bacterium]|nr:hypothetical protein [Bacteroidales bacterium]
MNKHKAAYHTHLFFNRAANLRYYFHFILKSLSQNPQNNNPATSFKTTKHLQYVSKIAFSGTYQWQYVSKIAFSGTDQWQYVPKIAFSGTYQRQYVPKIAFPGTYLEKIVLSKNIKKSGCLWYAENKAAFSSL